MSGTVVSPIITFSVILFASLIIPEGLKKLKITSVPFYIIAGILLGPYGIGLHLGEGLIFLGDIGLLFLVFLAGLEVYEMAGGRKNDVYYFSFISAVICFTGGAVLGYIVTGNIYSSLLMGTILVSSSIAEIVAMVNATPSVKQRLGGLIIPSIVILDATSLIMLGIIVKLEQPLESLLLFFVEAAVLIVFTLYVLPRFFVLYFERKSRKPREGDLKFIVAILMAIVAISHIIGLHGIVAAFLVGLVMGKFIPSEEVYVKLHGIGHGMLIPVFFVVLGMRLDIGILANTSTMIMPLLLIGTLIVVKITSGVAFARLRGFPMRDGIILGLVLWPQLSATIAATTIGYETGIFDQTILVSVVIMAMFSALGTPFVLRFYTRKESKELDLDSHTIIGGYGRTTSKITYMLHKMGVPVVVIDINPNKLRPLARYDIPTIFGNVADTDVLRQAAVRKAKVCLLAIKNEHDLYIAARKIRKMNPECHVIAKIHTEKIYSKLQSEKLVDEFIWPEKMSSAEAVNKVYSKILMWEKT